MYFNNLKPATKNFNRSFPLSLNNFFDELLINDGAFVPSVNIAESKEKFELEFSVPGYVKEDFNLNIKDDVLTVSAKHEEKKDENEKNFTRQEFKKRSFSRSFTLSEKVNQENVDAKYENGILHITLGKVEKNNNENTREIKIS